MLLELESFITMPASSGGGLGRARISALRSLSDGRLFVNDLRGPIYRIDTGSAQLYVNIDNQISAFIDQPGLGTGFQSFAFHPDFLTNGKFYTTHTEAWNSSSTPDFIGPTTSMTSSGHQGVISEWTATDPSSNTFSGTRRELFRVYFPGTIHGLQEIKFNPNAEPNDPDYGMLYICIGDGASYLSGLNTSQHRLDSALGTIFRIDPLGNDSENGNYGIPSDNPFINDTTPNGVKEIYAYGFRNPHRIGWDTGGTQRMFEGDIGEVNIEEINQILPGGDYGFPEREGTFLLDADNPSDHDNVYPLPSNDDQFDYTYPLAQYDHDEGIAMMLGGVYRGDAIPGLQGTMIFGDVAWGRVFFIPDAETNLVLGSQATIQEARLELDGDEGSLTSFVGSSRADLRFGFDGDGEMYLLTKTDGKIRKIVGARFGDDAKFDSDPEDWEMINDFEAGFGGVKSSSGEFTIVPDPFSDSSNHVLSVKGAGAAGNTSFSAISSTEDSSLFLRFAFEDTDVAVSIGATTLGSSFSRSPFAIEVEGSGRLAGGSTPSQLTDQLRPGVWYRLWLILEPDTGLYSVYIKGDQWTTATLLASGLDSTRSMAGLKNLIWAIDAQSSGDVSFYLDDLYVDTTDGNLSAPIDDTWLLVSNFEIESRIDDWTFVDSVPSLDVPPATSTSTPPQSSVEWVEELSGNNFLSIQATDTDRAHTMGYAPLPTSIEVSHIYTFYGRVLVEDSPVSQMIGLSNLPEEEIEDMRFDAFEVQGRVSNSSVSDPLQWTIWDDLSEAPITDPVGGFTLDPLFEDTWYEYWMVVRNGGEASGGQTYDVYLRPDFSEGEPELVYSDAGFSEARERALRYIGIVADQGENGFGGRVGYDDLFLHTGENVSRPNGTGVGPFPGPRGLKTVPWLGQLLDSYWPWTYHETHDWIYVVSQPGKGMWIYDRVIGWFWTRPEWYPYVYLSVDSEWAWYQVGSSNPRWFYGFDRESWFTDQ